MITNKTIDRFYRKVNKTDGCWIWTAAKRGSMEYGCFGINGKTIRAHRFSYEITKGPINKDKIIMHICDNPSCVNPDHLLEGTHKENMQDAIKKGRFGILHGSKEECKYGHDLTVPMAIVFNKKGSRICRLCRNISSKKNRRAKNGKQEKDSQKS